MAIFGNIVTSFSWFGVNMLGVSLYSYGFMQKVFPWLLGFMISATADRDREFAVGSLEKFRITETASPDEQLRHQPRLDTMIAAQRYF